jgi:hypothetical protein
MMGTARYDDACYSWHVVNATARPGGRQEG